MHDRKMKPGSPDKRRSPSSDTVACEAAIKGRLKTDCGTSPPRFPGKNILHTGCLSLKITTLEGVGTVCHAGSTKLQRLKCREKRSTTVFVETMHEGVSKPEMEMENTLRTGRPGSKAQCPIVSRICMSSVENISGGISSPIPSDVACALYHLARCGVQPSLSLSIAVTVTISSDVKFSHIEPLS